MMSWSVVQSLFKTILSLLLALFFRFFVFRRLNLKNGYTENNKLNQVTADFVYFI